MRPHGVALLAGAAILFAAGGPASPAWGHANLRGTDPPMGSRLAVPPPSIRLWFDEAVVPDVSTLRLLDRAGKIVQEGPLKFPDPERRAAEFPLGKLGPGAYTVSWKVLSAVDGHVTRGAFAFASVPPGSEAAVGALAAPAPASLAQRAWAGVLRVLRVAAVWAHLGSLLALTGGCVAWLVVVCPVAPPQVARGCPPALARLLFRAALLSLAGGVVSLQLEWLQVSEAPPAQTLQVLVFFPAIPVALGTWSSIAAFIRLALLTGVASLATRLQEDDLIALPGVVILSLSSLASVAVASHTASAGGLWWAVPDFVHLAAAALWTGGLVLLALLALAPERAAGRGADRIRLAEAMRRFTPWAAGSVVLLVLTGIASSTVHIPGWAALWRTLYGGTLALKVTLLLPLLALALLNSLWCRGRLSAGPAEGAGGPRALARLWARGERRFRRADWAVRGEVLLAGAALLLAAGLTQFPPPKDLAYEPPPPITLRGKADGFVLAASITSPQGILAPSRVALSILDTQGQPPPPDARVILRPEMLEHEMRVLPVTARLRGDGWYDAEVFFSMLGRWEVKAIVRRKGAEDAVARFALNLGDAGFAPVDPAARGGTRLSLAAAWAGRSTRRKLLIGAGLALGAFTLGGLGAWRRKWVEAAVAGGLLAVGGIYLWSAMAVDTTPATLRRNPIPADARSIEAGRALYLDNCAICHGAAGRPSRLDLTPTLAAYTVTLDLTADHMAQHTDGDLFWWIARGIPGTPMPAFGDSLNDEERWHLVNYLRSLRRRAIGSP